MEQHKYDLKNTWKVLKGAIGKAHKAIKIEKINFEGKEFTDKTPKNCPKECSLNVGKLSKMWS